MTFGKKLKGLRNDQGLTQDELAEKLYVTRTAISKWETGKGFPGIDSLKEISRLFKISIDDLISDDDALRKRRLEEKKGRKLYWCAVVCFSIAVIFAVIYTFKPRLLFQMISMIGVVSYMIFGFLSKPNQSRMVQRRRLALPLVVSRLIVAFLIGAIIVFDFVK